MANIYTALFYLKW